MPNPYPDKLKDMQRASRQRHGCEVIETIKFYDDALLVLKKRNDEALGIKIEKKIMSRHDKAPIEKITWLTPPPLKQKYKKGVIEDKKIEIKRPPTIYSNIPSPYGLYDELKSVS